jgi:hypothetical protein
MPLPAQVPVENVNTPGRVSHVDAEKYHAMRDALLRALPRRQPGLTQAEMGAAVQPHLRQDLWPGGAKSLWWLKTVQLDLEAKGLVQRDRSARPLRWHRTGPPPRPGSQAAPRSKAPVRDDASAAAVDACLHALGHPQPAAIAAVRAAICAVDRSIEEGVKWNAPSFRTTEWFATLFLRDRPAVAVILHRGARARALPANGLRLADPTGLLQWLGPGRARVVFADVADVRRKRAAFQRLVRQWLRQI